MEEREGMKRGMVTGGKRAIAHLFMSFSGTTQLSLLQEREKFNSLWQTS